MKCKNYECENPAAEGYLYCSDCYNSWKQKNSRSSTPVETKVGEKPANQWHTDPVVDQLMKMGANQGKIAQELANIRSLLENLLESKGNKPEPPKKAHMKRTKEALITEDDLEAIEDEM